MKRICYRRLLHISYKDRIANAIVFYKLEAAIGPYEAIITTVRKGNYDGSDMWSDGRITLIKGKAGI